MATAATYETGFFSTPGDLLTAARQVNGQVQNVEAAIDGNSQITQDWWDSWEAFRSRWLQFYSRYFAGAGFAPGGGGSLGTATASWFTSDVEGQLYAFEQQVAGWVSQARAQPGVIVPGPDIEAPDNTLGLPSLSMVGIVIGLVVVLVLLEKL